MPLTARIQEPWSERLQNTPKVPLLMYVALKNKVLMSNTVLNDAVICKLWLADLSFDRRAQPQRMRLPSWWWVGDVHDRPYQDSLHLSAHSVE